MIRTAAVTLASLLACVAILSARQDAKLGEFRHVLDRRLDSIATSLDGVLGYTIVDLTTGERNQASAGFGFPDGLHDQARDSLRAVQAGG